MFHKFPTFSLEETPSQLARPKEWTQRSDYGGISDDMIWSHVMGDLRKHYIADAYKAQILHLMRISRLPMVKWQYPEDHVFKKRAPGCGICDQPIVRDLHEHMFCKCEVMGGLLALARIPSVETLKDWIFLEGPSGTMPTITNHVAPTRKHKEEQCHKRAYLRELAHAIWKIERDLRYSGADAREQPVQSALLHHLQRAQQCFYDGDVPITTSTDVE